MNAIQTSAMPILRYGFGIVSWTVNDLRAMHRKVRKMLVKGKFHHPKSNTHQLYMARELGGRGLIVTTGCHIAEYTGLASYVFTARLTDSIVNIMHEVENAMTHGLMSSLPKQSRERHIKSTTNMKGSFPK